MTELFGHLFSVALGGALGTFICWRIAVSTLRNPGRAMAFFRGYFAARPDELDRIIVERNSDRAEWERTFGRNRDQ